MVLPLCSSISPSLNLTPNSVKISGKRFESIVSTASTKEFGARLQSCIDSKSLDEGKRLHYRIQEAGFEGDLYLLPKLIKLYAVCGRVDYARQLFDRMPKSDFDAFSWTAMISGYIRNGNLWESFDLFLKMLEFGVKPDGYTFSALLKAAAELKSVRLTAQLHSMIAKSRFRGFLSVSNSLIHAYGSLEDVGEAKKVFEMMEVHDVVSFSAMVQSFCSVGRYADAMALFSKMQFEECLRPNELTVVSLLPACGFFSCLRKGQGIHAFAIRNCFQFNVIVVSAFVTMYSQCGEPDTAYKMFCSLKAKNVIVWTAMIEGFSLNGRFDRAMELFMAMQDLGLKPNYITLVVILCACSHGGYVDEGLQIFYTMEEKFSIKAGVEHYACVVDMLGRRGRLDDAEKFIENMKIEPTGSVLGSLLGACQVHRNLEIGERTAYKLFELEPQNTSNYVFLSNIYASVGRWEDVGKIRHLMNAEGLSKDLGRSWIELKDGVHVFGAHDKSHADVDNIYKVLEDLSNKIVQAGYVPSTKYVLLDVEEENKGKLLCSHSERLAIAFGLLKAPPNAPIRIAKNLRVCGDCHYAIKLISKVTFRELIIRDTNRFHHFSEGKCSCGDYW